jgi:hypothetical protein
VLSYAGRSFSTAWASPRAHHPPPSFDHPPTTTSQDSPSRVRDGAPGSSLNSGLLAMLYTDDSPLALRPRNRDKLVSLVSAVDAASLAASPASTLSKDDGAWKRWVAYTAEMGTSPWRTDVRANSGVDDIGHRRETLLLAGFLMWVYRRMRPRCRTDRAPKPQSAFNVVLAVRRVHKRADFIMASTHRVVAVLRALLRQYIVDHGPEALLPRRKEPLHAGILRRIRLLAPGTRIGRRVLDWGAPFFVMIWAVLTVGLAAGFRKCELAVANGAAFGTTDLSRAHLTWRIGGVDYAVLTPELFSVLCSTDFAVLRPIPTKNDAFGDIFGTEPIWLPVDRTEPTNAAMALAALELAFPVAPSKRRSTPLFCVDLALTALVYSVIDAVLRAILVWIVADPSAYSVHSLRIACATALLEEGASYTEIQAFCRWQTNASVALYARMSPDFYGKWVRKIACAEPSAISATRLPTIDGDDVAAFLSAAGLGEGAVINVVTADDN